MEALIHQAVSNLKDTSYERMAPLEMAPIKTDCLTAIHYVFQRTLGIGFPVSFIGDVPRMLINTGNWALHEIDLKEVCCGDVIFVKRILEPKLLGHAALLLGPNKIFHCRRDLGGVTESFDRFFSTFEQQLMHNQVRYIDPRNRELREKYKSKFIPVQ